MPYIGLDVGTSQLKASLIGEDGTVLHTAVRAYPLHFPHVGWAELDIHEVYACVLQALGELAGLSRDIRALAVSSIGEMLVFADGEGNALANGIVYLDSRCRDIAADFNARMPQRKIHSTTGIIYHPMYSVFQYHWMKQNRPDVFRKTKQLFLLGEYLTYRLCGERAIDPATASRTMLLDIHTRKWSSALFEAFQIDTRYFSPLCSIGADMGTITADIAAQTGLPATARVFAGCHDQIAATVGMGVLTPGDMSASEGSTESLNTVLAKEDINFDACFDHGVSIEPFVFNNQYVLPLGQLSHGTAIRWFVKQHEDYYQKKDPQHSLYDVADRLCAEDSYGLFFIPYLSQSSCMNTENRIPASFIGINTSTSIEQMYRAVLEGLSFESLDNVNRLRSLGIAPHRIIASGGCVQAEHLMQIKADVFRKPIEIQQNTNTAALGLCMLCAVGCGDVADLFQAKDRFTRISYTILPQKEYSQPFNKYVELRNGLGQLF